MEKKYEWKDHVIFMGLLLALAVWVNHGIQIKGLYMDDLYFWSCYGEQSFFEYVFPMGSTRFRFLYYLAAWLEMAVVRNHVALFVPINILLNAALSWYLYSIAWRLSRAKAIGFFTGAMFLASRMAYYQIGQVLGLMETMALWMAISILWNLYRYVNEENREKCFYIASLLYFGVCFVHERYMALLPLLLLALLLKQCKKISLWLSTIVSFGLVQLIRAFTIGSVLPAGTGGTQVADTLNILQAIKFAFSQAAYVFGINAGPEHLNGCPWSESPMWVKGLIGMADGMLLIMVLAFLVKFIMEKRKERKFSMLFNTMLFIGFKYCLIQRYHTCGNALDLCIPSWCIALPFLYLRRTDRRSKKRTVFKTPVSLGHSLCTLRITYVSGRTVLPQLLSKIVSVAGSAAL